MSKNIVFCADGTWNNATEDETHTNVYELFELLKGNFREGFSETQKEQEKEYKEAGGVVQIAKYMQGVGNSDNIIVKGLEGITGGGTITRIIRGYTFISRNYEPGDSIFIAGFSRGAYTARALADFIATKGLLPKSATTDKDAGYKKGTQAWYEYREQATEKCGLKHFLAEVQDIKAKMRGFFFGERTDDGEFVEAENITALAVWDTVGKLGIPIFIKDKDGDGGTESYDAFRFCGTKLNPKIQHGLHAVALDEHRADFSPTLWDADERIKQMVFAGAHADVGGGYPENGLSQVTLQWMVDELMGLGLLVDNDRFGSLSPDPAATAHIPWKGLVYLHHDRNFDDMTGHCSVSRRGQAGPVKPDPDPVDNAVPYKPDNLPEDICTKPSRKLCTNCRYAI